jgi:light-regulated signal transduction histidine kinase (bacteriophytochrome)
MNSLLKRQIRKYFGNDAKLKEAEPFIDAVNRSYQNFDEQFVMLQRSMIISSDELSEANQKLKLEAKEQKEVINKLNSVINRLKSYNLSDKNSTDEKELSGLKLIEFIDNQTQKIIEINEQRDELLKHLKYQNQELSDFTHMVSHDLKSPLRSIDTLVTWLQEDNISKLDATGIENIRLIRSNVEKMDALISGILDYSSIGKVNVEYYDVDINYLIGEIISYLIIPEHIKITHNQLPVVKGDKFRLQQVFQNLISNAIKYNDKANGFIVIKSTELENYWQFSIEDNGKGIDETYFKKIFETFQTLQNDPNSTGIGLSIVKKIIEFYQGEIWIESKLTEGTTFFFTIKKK